MARSSMEDKITIYMCDQMMKPSLKGFEVLKNVILLSNQHPELNCEALFSLYANDGNWQKLYRAAKYCIANSMSATSGVYEFIKKCTIEIKCQG